MNGTDDGLGVVRPSSASAAHTTNFAAGILVKTLEPGRLGDVQVYGFNRNAAVIRGTRAASTDGWASMAAIAIGATLGVDTTNNGLIAGGQSMIDPFVVVAEPVASAAAKVSSNNGMNPASALVYYQAVKTFLRFM